MKRPLKILALLVALLLVVLAAGLAILLNTDFSEYRGELEQYVSTSYGYELRINGAFEPKLSLRPSLLVEKVSIANPEWATDPNLATLKRLFIRLDLWSLFKGPVRVNALQIDGLHLWLEETEDGKANWTPADTDDDTDVAPPARMVLNQLAVSDIKITYRSAGGADAREILLSETTISPQRRSGLLDLKLSGELDGEPLTARGTLGPVRGLITGRNIRHDLEAKYGDYSIESSGSLDRISRLEGLDAKSTISGPDLTEIARWAGLEQAPEGPFEIEAGTREDAGSLTIEADAKVAEFKAKISATVDHWWHEPEIAFDLALESDNTDGPLGRSPLTVKAGFMLEENELVLKPLSARWDDIQIDGWVGTTLIGKPRIRADIRTGPLDFSQTAEGDPEVTETEKPKDKRIFGNTELQLGLLSKADLDARIQVQQLEDSFSRVEGLDFKVKIEDGDLTIDSLQGVANGGQITGRFSISNTATVPRVDTRISARDVRIVHKDHLHDLEASFAPMDMDLQLTLEGAAPHDMASSANGSMRFLIGSGLVDPERLAVASRATTREIFMALLPSMDEDTVINLECGVYKARIENGEAKIEPYAFQTDEFQLVGRGIVDLKTEKINGRIRTKHRKTLAVKGKGSDLAAGFIKIGGTLADPSVALNPTKTLATGTAAFLTGGLSLLGQNLLGRFTRGGDFCDESLKEMAEDDPADVGEPDGVGADSGDE